MKGTPLILIIEDDEDILELEEFHLSNAGFEVLGFRSTRGVEQALEEEEVSLLVVDRNLPGAEGSEFVALLRAKGYDLPVIFVSAKDQDFQVEEGFARGGDDYLRKPFNMNELVLRVRALLRRSGAVSGELLRHGDLILDPESRRLQRNGEEIRLSRLEFDLLAYLMRRPGRVVSREELLDEVWGDEEERGPKSVNVAINRLKKKIDREREASHIESVRGIGYRLC
ncbi:response regulator transcription factor [Nitratifractor sp.]